MRLGVKPQAFTRGMRDGTASPSTGLPTTPRASVASHTEDRRSHSRIRRPLLDEGPVEVATLDRASPLSASGSTARGQAAASHANLWAQGSEGCHATRANRFLSMKQCKLADESEALPCWSGPRPLPRPSTNGEGPRPTPSTLRSEPPAWLSIAGLPPATAMHGRGAYIAGEDLLSPAAASGGIGDDIIA
jgi:hypothetical protein